MESSHTIQLSRGWLPSFPRFFFFWVFCLGVCGVNGEGWGGGGSGALVCLPSSPRFPSCSCSNSVFIFTPRSLWSGWALMREPCLLRLSRTEALVGALTSKRAPTPPQRDHPPPPPNPPVIHFAEKVSSSSSASQVRAPRRRRPVSPRGQSTPSHMPRRLARSSAPLRRLIAPQERRKNKKRARRSAVSTAAICCATCWQEVHQTDHVHVLLSLAFVKPQALFPEIFCLFFFPYHLPSRASRLLCILLKKMHFLSPLFFSLLQTGVSGSTTMAQRWR